jgi:hypothetical protein
MAINKQETKMANQALNVVAVDKAIQLLFASAGAVIATVVLVGAIYSFGFSRGEDHGSRATMEALQTNQRSYSVGGGSSTNGTCIYSGGSYTCH